MKMQEVNDKQSLMNGLAIDIQNTALYIQTALNTYTSKLRSKKSKHSGKESEITALHHTLMDLVNDIKSLNVSAFILRSTDIDALSEYVKALKTTYLQWQSKAHTTKSNKKKNRRSEKDSNNEPLRTLLESIDDKMVKLKGLLHADEQENLRKLDEAEKADSLPNDNGSRLENKSALLALANADKSHTVSTQHEEKKAPEHPANPEKHHTQLLEAEAIYTKVYTTLDEIAQVLALPQKSLNTSDFVYNNLKSFHDRLQRSLKTLSIHEQSSTHDIPTSKSSLPTKDIEEDIKKLSGLMRKTYEFKIISDRMKNSHELINMKINEAMTKLPQLISTLRKHLEWLKNKPYTEDNIVAYDEFYYTAQYLTECESLNNLKSQLNKYDFLDIYERLTSKANDQIRKNTDLYYEFRRVISSLHLRFEHLRVISSLIKLDLDAPNHEKTKALDIYEELHGKLYSPTSTFKHKSQVMFDYTNKLKGEFTSFIDSNFSALPAFSDHLKATKIIANFIIKSKESNNEDYLMKLLFKRNDEREIIHTLNKYALSTKSLFTSSQNLVRENQPSRPPESMHKFVGNWSGRSENHFHTLFYTMLENNIILELEHKYKHNLSDTTKTEVKKELNNILNSKSASTFNDLLDKVSSFAVKSACEKNEQEDQSLKFTHM